MAITGLVHVNINCSDYDRSRAFYEQLGFVPIIDVPPTNTPEVAAAVGLPPYRVKGALVALKSATPFVIDLLEWQSPRNDAAPYGGMNHLGIARIAMATDDLDADVAKLKEMDVKFLSEPVRLKLGDGPATRFVCFEDPDGTVLELVQTES